MGETVLYIPTIDLREEKMIRQVIVIALAALLTTVCGYRSFAHAAGVDQLLKLNGGNTVDGPETWAKLYPMPQYNPPLAASG